MQDMNSFLSLLEEDHQHEKQYLSMVKHEAGLLLDILSEKEQWQTLKVFERLTLPDRIISFRVDWLDDEGNVQVNRSWRVQHCNLIGPYKGGLRFHPAVDLSTLKALAFEQTFKNALTGFPIGGAKGGSDFDPRGKSDEEIMRFCQSFMTELQRHIGPNVDVPAGDINVGTREIGYLFGQYKRIQNQFEGVLTGKQQSFGGSHVRQEATGYGVIYFLVAMMNAHDKQLKDKKVCVSGAGNVALHAAEKAIALKANVITLANSRGTLVSEDGLKQKHLDWLKENNNLDNALKDMAAEFDLEFQEDTSPWQQKCDVALPCATQNEVSEKDIQELSDNGCLFIAEGSNMALTTEALEELEKTDIVFGPGKAANAGGVAMSAMEMSQNAQFTPKPFDELEDNLESTMNRIFALCQKHATRYSHKPDYVQGASIAGFKVLAEAMIAQGI